MRHIQRFGLMRTWLLASLSGGLLGCGAGQEEAAGGPVSDDAEALVLGSSAEALTAAQCQAIDLDIDKSLMVHDATTINARDFSLTRTLNQIIASSAGRRVTPAALLQSLIDDFALTRATNADSGLNIPVDSRPPEAGLRAANLLDSRHPDFMEPVALVNRWDLIPASGEHCGEYRIIYAKKDTNAGRFFLIFEAALPNPNPAQGIAGCVPVAEFWTTLSDTSLFPTAASRAAKLEEFYFTGLPNGVGPNPPRFSPVVAHTNYGVPFGQVRSNHFMGFIDWQLREWRTGFDPVGAPTFLHDTVKENPLTELYDGNFVPSGVLAAPAGAFARTRNSFRNDFVTTQIPIFSAPEREGRANSASQIINGFGSRFPNGFNEFQSHSQNGSDDPASVIDPVFQQRIDLAAPAGLTGEHLLNRAISQSCAGCHQVAVGREVGVVQGQPVFWPASNFFTHVDEGGTLSPALVDFFLPARRELLRAAACASPCTGGSCPGGGTNPTVLPIIDSIRRLLQRFPDSPAVQAALNSLLQRLEGEVQTARSRERAQPGVNGVARRVH